MCLTEDTVALSFHCDLQRCQDSGIHKGLQVFCLLGCTPPVLSDLLPHLPALVKSFQRGLVMQPSILQEHCEIRPSQMGPEDPQGAVGPRTQKRRRASLSLQSHPLDGGVDKIAALVRFQQIQIKVEEISLKLENKTSPN